MAYCSTCNGPLKGLGADTYEDKMLASIAQFKGQGATLSLRLSTSEKISGTGKQYAKIKNAFSLPAGPQFSCPGATDQCEGCYAQAGRFAQKNVLPAYAKNWVRWRWLEAQDAANRDPRLKFRAASAVRGKAAATELVGLMRRTAYFPMGVPFSFRLWESGDFHSQWSVDVWTNVVRNFPQVAFWGYTRTFNLDYSELTAQPNMLLWASTDRVNYEKAVEFVAKFPKIHHAFWWDPAVPAPSGSFVCPATQPANIGWQPGKALRPVALKKMPLDGRPDLGFAPGACGTCRYCLPDYKNGLYPTARRGDVTFMDHDLANKALFVIAYNNLQLAKKRGPANYPAMGPAMEQALIEAVGELEALREEERERRRYEAAQKGLKGLGQSLKSGLIDDCLYSYGRPDYFPG